MKKLLLVSFLFFSNYLLAQNSQSPPIKFCRSLVDSPPYDFFENNELKGTHVEITRAIFKRLGRTVKFYTTPFDLCLKYISYGNMDGNYFTFHKLVREKDMIFKEGNIISKEIYRFLVLKKNAQQYHGIGRNFGPLKKKRLGVIDGYFYGQKFLNAQFEKVFRFNRDDDLLYYLMNERLDAVVLGEGSLPYKTKQLKGQFSVLKEAIADYPIYVVFSKKNRLNLLAEKFSAEMKKFKITEEYKEILKKYLKSGDLFGSKNQLMELKKQTLGEK